MIPITIAGEEVDAVVHIETSATVIRERIVKKFRFWKRGRKVRV